MALRVDDLFASDSSSSYWSAPENSLRRDLLQRVSAGQFPGVPDDDLAESLVRLARDELLAYATSGQLRVIDDEDIQLVLRACAACCDRVGVDFPHLPFRDFSTFRRYWLGAGMYGSYAPRRACLDQVLDPMFEKLDGIAVRSWADALARPISPHGKTGWVTIDLEFEKLRRRFRHARTPRDYCAVGTVCVRIVGMLANVAFDPAVHLPVGCDLPPRDHTKARFDLIVEHHFEGQDNHLWRKYARSVIEIAQDLKYRTTPTRCQSGIACDAVIQLANVLRRITTG